MAAAASVDTTAAARSDRSSLAVTGHARPSRRRGERDVVREQSAPTGASVMVTNPVSCWPSPAAADAPLLANSQEKSNLSDSTCNYETRPGGEPLRKASQSRN